jgi:hypothetical protein
MQDLGTRLGRLSNAADVINNAKTAGKQEVGVFHDGRSPFGNCRSLHHCRMAD